MGKNGKVRVDDRAWQGALTTLHEAQWEARTAFEREFERLRDKALARLNNLVRDTSGELDAVRAEMRGVVEQSVADAQAVEASRAEAVTAVASLGEDLERLRALSGELRATLQGEAARSLDDVHDKVIAMLGSVEADAQELRAGSSERLQALVATVDADERAASALHGQIEQLTRELDPDDARARLDMLVSAGAQELRAETRRRLEEVAEAVARQCEIAADHAMTRSSEIFDAATARGQELSVASSHALDELVAGAETHAMQTRDDVATSAVRLLDGMEANARAVEHRREQVNETLRAIEAGAKELETEGAERMCAWLEESEAHADRVRDIANHAAALQARADANMRSIGQEARQQAIGLLTQVDADLQSARDQITELHGVIAEIRAASVAFDDELTRGRESLEASVKELLAAARQIAETEMARYISQLDEMQECQQDASASGDEAASLHCEPLPDRDAETEPGSGEWNGINAAEAEPRVVTDLFLLDGDAGRINDADDLFFTNSAAELQHPASGPRLSRDGEPDGARSQAEPYASMTQVRERIDPGALAPPSSHPASTWREHEADPIEVTVSAKQLATCAEQLVSGGPDQLVRLDLSRTVSQRAGYGYLGLATYDPRGWWECNGLAVSVNADERRSVIVDLHDLLSALGSLGHNGDTGDAIINWRDDIVIGSQVLPAADLARIPELSSDRTRVEQVHLSDALRSGCVLETQIGRLHVSAYLGGHLLERNVRTAELVMISDKPFLSARTSVAGDGGAAPLILAPLEALARETPLPKAPERRGEPNAEITELFLAMSPTVSMDDLLQVLNNGVGYARRKAAMHPSLPEAVISDLITEGTEAMRAAAAMNISIGPDAARRAAADSSPVVRTALASNPSIPVEVLELAALDSDPAVRATVAGNPVAPTQLLDVLSRDAEPSVRAAVAANHRVDAEILHALAEDEDPMVCRALTVNPRCPHEVLVELAGTFPELVLMNSNAPAILLAAGAHLASATLRAKVAGNPATPRAELKRLASDRDYHVLRAIAEHPRTPTKARMRAQQRLAMDWGDYSARSVGEEPYPSGDAMTSEWSNPFSTVGI